MRYFLVTILSFVVSLTTTAQTYKGKVVDESGKPLCSASVVLLADGGRTTLSFTRTAGDGSFTLSESGKDGKRAESILFSYIGYARDTISVKDFRQGQTIIMHEKSVIIKETKIRAPRVSQRGDTLTYLVNSFKQKQDRTIADVIKKMPGLQVGEDGTITYQGKQINKFYIEGLDMLGSKYSQASENISADKVKSVQVYERHQPVKLLRDVTFSDQAALNIVLTDDARNVWQGLADIGAGTKAQKGAGALGDSRLMAMMFSRKMQSISMYKYNNTGKDVMKEVHDRQSIENDAAVENSILGGIAMPAPSLDPVRTTFNNSNLLATNWLFKTHHGDDLRLQVSGLLDKTTQSQTTQTVYTDLADGNAIVEDVDATQHTSEISAELKYEKNRDDIYLVNTLKGYADFNKSTATTMLNGRGMYENVKPRKRYLQDSFTMSKRLKNNHLLSLSAYFSYNNLPGRLLLSDSTMQRLDMQSFHWGAQTYFSHKAGRFNFKYTLSTKGKSQQLSINNTMLNGNDSYYESDTRLTPEANYSHGSFRLTATVPLVWLARGLNSDTRNDFLVEPSVKAVFRPTARWDFSAAYSYSYNPLDVSLSGSLPIFTDYITMRQGVGRLSRTMSHALNGQVDYKNTIKGQFATLLVTWNNLFDNILYSSEMVGDIYKSCATDKTSDSHILTVFARLAQSFRWSKLNIGVTAYYACNDYDMLVSDVVTPFLMNNLIVSADISLQPAEWLSFEAYSSYTMSNLKNKSNGVYFMPTLNSFSHGIKAFLMPGSWQIEWNNEIYHSNDKSVSFNYFSDISVFYRRKTYEIGLTLDNIFGNNTYRRQTVNTTVCRYQIMQLRPRSVMARISFNF